MAQVDRFQEDETVPVFLISLKAGGTGLNLTAADVVVHFDPWWNPAAEAQASDRAHRIGQDKQVTVYKLITSGTVEENVLQLQKGKQKLLEQVFEESEAANSISWRQRPTRTDLNKISISRGSEKQSERIIHCFLINPYK